jgi:Tol biopolymer transport system component
VALSAGARLGPYEILALIGAGGMGEVYRARDTKLDRDVAIKVLPEALADDPERLARFEREAKVLAALNHPNIAVIHGLVETGDVRALVMELIPGEILKGPLPVETALRHARQVAEALEAAHEKGIVHRDLKPANLMVTSDGLVKVLDFGLAAVPQASGPDADDSSHSPTLTMAATQAGMILGTAGYMSPEQAAGSQVDKRADIWSFGVVLWEMLTGARLFASETVSLTLADVLRAPVDFDKVPKETPRVIRDMLRRCLTRDVKQRLRDIGEARIAIDQVLSGSEKEPGVAASPHRRVLTLWAVAAILGVALGGLAYLHFRQPAELRVVNSTLAPPEGGEFDFGASLALPALSPDGTRIVFGAKPKDGKSQIWLRRLDSPTAQPLAGTENAIFPFWSPDSRWVAFGQSGKLKKIDVQGGPAVVVTDVLGAFRGGSWSPAGVIVFATGIAANSEPGHGLFRVAAAGGSASPATTLEPGEESSSHVFPWFLPDGRNFLYTRQQEGNLPVRVGSLDEPGKPGKVVAQTNSSVMYAQGHLLYLRDNTLMAQPFDPGRLETTGEAVPLAGGVPIFVRPSRPAGFTVSAGGLLLYQSGAVGAQTGLVWKDRQGRTLGKVGESTGLVDGMALSPDGRRVAVGILNGSTNHDIWIYDVARGIPTRFTFDPADHEYPVWSPDGSTIYFTSRRGGHADLFRKAANGASAEELVLADSNTKFAASVSPDGKLLLFDSVDPNTGYDLWVLPLSPAQSRKPEPRTYLRTPFLESRGKFSPDRHWVAYQSNESGQFEVYAAPFPGPGGKRQISSGGGVLARWRRDGKELFYIGPDGQLMAYDVHLGNGTLEVGRVQKLFAITTPAASMYDVSADGQKFLVVDGGIAPSTPLTLVENWTASLPK